MATVLSRNATLPGGTGSLLPVYRPAAPVFVAGSGCRVFDADGAAYLDFGSGIGVNALGYGDAGVRAAITTALDAGLIHTSNLFRTRAAPALAATLTELSFADCVFFCNSGAEANEAAFKFARRWGKAIGGAAKHEIVSVRGAFHGRLFGTLAATDRRTMQEPFEPLMPGVRFIDVAADPSDLREIVTAERTAAIIIEPVQGEGGVRPVSASVLRQLRQLADEVQALLIFDEVQCGLGRTGRLFAYEHSGVTPDIMTLAKPLAGGLPMGAALTTERVAAFMQVGDHATTFGGGPLVAAAALEVVQRIAAPEFLATVAATGDYLGAWLGELRSLPSVAETRGIGLMWGIETTEPAAPIVARALAAGLIVTLAGERVIRLLPPLVIGEAEVDEAIGVLRELLS